MQKLKKICPLLLFAVFQVCYPGKLWAQTACPAVNAGPDVTLSCNQSCAALSATFVPSGATTSYQVGSIPYTPFPFTGGTNILVNQDDVWSGVINLPFTFCFFGQSYNRVVVGANGLISFNTAAYAGAFCPWNTTAAGTIPTNNMPVNSIMAPYHDIDPSLPQTGKTINYQLLGTAPCRILVVSYYNIELYSGPDASEDCSQNPVQTHQIAIYETTNIIETYIKEKTACVNWNGGLGVHGIQNAAGNAAFVVPGRNNTVWNATNDAWRFTPNGASIVTVNWFQGATQIGTGNSVSVCPTTPTTYTAQATYLPCTGGSPVVVSDNIFVGLAGLTSQIDSSKNVSCFGGSNGMAYASFNTTSTVLAYGWTPGPQNTTTLSNVPAGTYVFTVSTAGGCTQSDTVVITQSPQLTVNVPDSTFSTCSPPGSQGVLAAYVSGGTPSGTGTYTYQWNNSQNGQFATGLTAGTYTATVTDSQGCTASDPGTVIYQNIPPSFGPPQITNVSCNGGNNGAIIVVNNNVTPPVNYAWSGGLPNNDTVVNLITGTYNVTATDANNCSVSATYSITQPTALLLGAPTVNGATCAAGGSLAVTASGGTGTLIYSWSNGASTGSISNLAAGPYDLTVTDQNGCSITATYTVTAAPNVVTFGAPNITDVSCFGGSDGSITVNASGGTGTISFAWSNSQSGAAISNLSAATYSVTASDQNNCTASISYVVNEPLQITFGAPVIVDATCTAGGSLTITATGGTGSLSFAWSNGQAGASVTNLNPGSYSVTATDQNNCTASASFTVGASPNLVVITNVNITDVSCTGSSDGLINITTTGGVGAITVSWSNGQSGNGISNLLAGSYTVTATDQTGCSTTATYNVTEPASLVLNNPVIQNVGCSGANDGSITANASGGTAPYTYIWQQQSNSQVYQGQTISNLTAGTYDLIVSDQNNCTATASYVVNQSVPLTFTQSSVNASCFGSTDGAASITVTSGTPPYQFNWNNTGNASNNSLTNLPAGPVSVVITDANCSATASFIITQPTQVSIALTAKSDPACNGAADGTITVTASGGSIGPASPGYTYVWSNGQTGALSSGLVAGSYTVVAADDNGCSASATYALTDPTPVQLSLTAIDPSCYQGNNGSLTVNPTGGAGGYTYLWSDNQTTQTAVALLAGPHSVTVTDQSGCSTTVSGTLTEPTEILIGYTVTAVTCPGKNDGTVTAIVSGGTPPYSYSATKDFANFIFTTNGVVINLAPGDYSLLVSDLNGCTKVELFNIPDAVPDSFVYTIDSTSCYGDAYNDGKITIEGTVQQNQPFQYSVDGSPLQFSGEFFNLSAGPHVITAINQFGCETTIPVVVEEPLPILAQVQPSDITIALGEGTTVQVNYQNAVQPAFTWSPSTGLSCSDCQSPYVSPYANTQYVVTVSMMNGDVTCFGTATLNVNVLPQKPLYIPNAFTPNGDGNNDVFQIYGEDIKTIDLKIFNRWGELVFESDNQFNGWDGTYKGVLQNPAVFTYYVTITYLNDKKTERKGTVTILR